MSNKQPNNELEKRLSEFKDQPGFILGLDGWILRSVPVGQRKRFLDAYEKALQVAHHPDLFQDEAEKSRHQRFLQTVANAIKFLTGDPFAYELATEDVPTKQNNLLKAKETIGARDKEIVDLKDKLDSRNRDYIALMSERHELEERIEQMKKDTLELGPFARLKAYQDYHIGTKKIYTPLHSGRLFVKSTKMRSTFAGIPLHEVISRDEKNFGTVDKKFSATVKKEYLAQDDVYLKLTNGVCEYKLFRATLIGGFPALAIKEFADYQKAKAGLEVESDLVDLVASSEVKLTVRGRSNAETAHREKVSSFVTPYFSADMPILVKFEQMSGEGHVNYELLYVNEVRELK